MAHPTIRTYEITNRTSGLSLGVYEGATAEEALEELARAAGYESRDDEARQLGRERAELDAELLVEDTREPFRRAAQTANELLVEVGMTTPERPIVWIDECGLTRINPVGQGRPGRLDVEALRPRAERLLQEYGEDSEVVRDAQDLWDGVAYAGQHGWYPATGRMLATEAFHLGVSLERARRGA